MRSLRFVTSVAVLLVVALAAPLLAPRGAVAVSAAQGLGGECTIAFPTETVQIMAPASPGGGWDTTAREMAAALQEGVVDQTVEVFNVPGAGGTVGLAQLVGDERGNAHLLMMMGLVMVGAIETNQSPVTLADVTPIARLTTEYEVVVVPKDSEYQTLGDLIAAFRADPTAISWGGGSAGGTDHILVGLIAQAVGVDPTQVNYVPFSGGGEALAAVLGGQVSAGVSGYGEWQDQIEAGELRALAISSGRAEGMATPAAEASPAAASGAAAVPTLQEQGVDVVLANWRGVVAPPEIGDDERACLVEMVRQMVGSEAWAQTLARYGWQDFYLGGEEFGQFIAEERARVATVLRDLGLVE